MKVKKVNFFGSNERVCQRSTIGILCVIVGMLVISVSCKKEDDLMKKNNIERKSSDVLSNFVIVTEEERQYLDNPEPIDEFRNHVSGYIDLAVDKMDCYFVFRIENGIVQNAVVGKNSTSAYPLWSSRLDGYIEISRDYPIINDDDPPIPDGVCTRVKNKRIAKQILNSLLEDPEVISVCMSKNDDGTWTVCWEYRP